MKRWICLLCVVAMLAALCTGCKNPKDPETGVKVYESFPTSLSIEKIGTLPQTCGTANGGLYFLVEVSLNRSFSRPKVYGWA